MVNDYDYIWGDWAYFGPIRRDILCKCGGKAILQPDGTYVCEKCSAVYRLKKKGDKIVVETIKEGNIDK